jgi:hypothetical protein
VPAASTDEAEIGVTRACKNRRNVAYMAFESAAKVSVQEASIFGSCRSTSPNVIRFSDALKRACSRARRIHTCSMMDTHVTPQHPFSDALKRACSRARRIHVQQDHHKLWGDVWLEIHLDGTPVSISRRCSGREIDFSQEQVLIPGRPSPLFRVWGLGL